MRELRSSQSPSPYLGWEPIQLEIIAVQLGTIESLTFNPKIRNEGGWGDGPPVPPDS